jgi:hypothetical protein
MGLNQYLKEELGWMTAVMMMAAITGLTMGI